MCHDDYAPLGAIVFSPWHAPAVALLSVSECSSPVVAFPWYSQFLRPRPAVFGSLSYSVNASSICFADSRSLWLDTPPCLGAFCRIYTVTLPLSTILHIDVAGAICPRPLPAAGGNTSIEASRRAACGGYHKSFSTIEAQKLPFLSKTLRYM